MSKLYGIDCSSINVFLKIFDAQVQPTVLYGAEIWGLESCSSVTDNVRLFGLKRYLGVDRRTPNDLVYGEVGRFPIQINAVFMHKILVKTDAFRGAQTAFESV